jgi:lipid-A-disaccharide synthase
MSPHIFLVAGEESGDRLGAALVEAIRQRTNGRVQFSAVGGAHLAAAGVPSLFPLGDLAIIGFAEIPASLPKIVQRIRETADAIVSARPDALIVIDSPEFTHRVAKRVRARAGDIPIIDYVCPSVWAWRPGRARAMRAYVDQVLALLPFEPKVMEKLGGPPCTYVGHPLTERLDDLRPKDLEKRLRLADPPLILVLPGSRRGEIRRMAPVFGAAMARIAHELGPVEIVLPAVANLADVAREAVNGWRVPVQVVTELSDKHEAFRTARAALTKSGTSTLELALAGIPMVAAYRVPLVEEAAARLLLNVPSVILANLVLGENVVPEFLQRHCTPKRLAAALIPLVTDTPERRRQIEAFDRLDTVMEVDKASPSDRSAALVLDIVGRKSRLSSEPAALGPATA